jgi:arylsulfatase A-like enzyme
MTRRICTDPRIALLSLAIAIGACRPERHEKLEVWFRLLDRIAGPVDERLEQGVHAIVDGVARPVFSTSDTRTAVLKCPRTPPGIRKRTIKCLVQPTEDIAAQWAIVEMTVLTERSKMLCRGFEASGPPCKVLVTRGTKPRTSARLVPKLAQRDVRTRPIAIPAGAVLRFAIAVEDNMWSLDSAPVAFTVTAVEGTSREEIFRRELDPSRVQADRRWLEETVDLDPLSGATVELVFATAPAEPGDDRPSLPLWADPVVLAPAARQLPSVVLVSLDTLRARSVSAYGHVVDTMPYLTRVATEGVLFEHASTTFPNTFGAHMTMLTGLLPATHAVRYQSHDRLPDDKPTLAGALRAAGYATAAFTEDSWLYAPAGFRRGFEYYVEDRAVARGGGNAAMTFGNAAAWVEANRDRPVFVFAHTYTVHSPYEPPAEYQTLFRRPDVDAKVLAYEQEARQLDDELKKFIERLELTLGRDFLLVITADHGEEFGEHGGFAHLQLYDEVMQVPLIARWPKQIAEGRRVTSVASLADVAPTILELLGLPADPTDGVSLARLARGGTDLLDRTVVFGESQPGYLKDSQWFFVARSATAKCFVPSGTGPSECYDVAQDPGERQPLAADASPEIALAHREAVAYRAHSQRTITPDRPDSAGATRDMDPEVKSKLKALGYIDE